MKITGLSKPTIEKAIQDLVDRRIISVVKGNNFKGKSSVYTRSQDENEWYLGKKSLP